ncbi:MAG: hypothetical protein M3Y59_17535 [Myxococcota bacterium]|nr:hypothetical protein [Myxococcota bacterium]
MSQPSADPSPPPRRPFWKNPFFLGFLVGITLLTILPFLQRKSLRAPDPLATLAPWELRTGAGGTVGSTALSGKVWIASFCVCPCRQSLPLSEVAPHVAKHAEVIRLVTVVLPSAEGGTAEELPVSGYPAWTVVTGPPAQLESLAQGFLEGLSRQTGLPPPSGARALAQTPRFALVDQHGAVRGFWPEDELGKGNVINAAVMLARYGPNP